MQNVNDPVKKSVSWNNPNINVGGNNRVENNSPEIPTADTLQLFRTESALSESEGSGIIAVDLDEFAHAVFVLLKYLSIFIKEKSIDSITQEFADEAAQMASYLDKWFRGQSVPEVKSEGVIPTEMLIGLCFAWVVLPLSILAIKAGVEETVEAFEQHNNLIELRGQKARAFRQFTNLHQSPAVSCAKTIEHQSVVAIDTAIDHNFYNGGIGLSSLTSGGAIFVSVAQNASLQIATLTAVSSPALTMAATIMGTLGVLLFGPVAGIAAVGLGGLFVHQARMVGEELREDLRVLGELARKNTLSISFVEKTYQAFIDKKFTSRQNFTNRFMGWNSGFLAGASVYAAGTIGKAVVAVNAILGAPTGGASLLVTFAILGIVGGVAMGVCSWQFLMWHEKSKKHQGYRLPETETPFLGRRFDAFQTAYTTISKTGVASSLRSALYNFVSERDKPRQVLLNNIATDLSKFRACEKRSTDKTVTSMLKSETKERYKDVVAGFQFVASYLGNVFTEGHDAAVKVAKQAYEEAAPEIPVSKVRERFKNIVAGFYFIGNYLSNVFTGQGHNAAVRIAREAYAREADELTAVALARWLRGEDGSKAEDGSFVIDAHTRDQQLRAVLTDMLVKQQKFLEDKCAAYLEFSALFTGKGLQTEVEEVTLAFAQVTEEYELDANRLAGITTLLEDKELSLDDLKREFLRYQGLSEDELPANAEQEEIHARFAEYVLTDMTEELTVNRGVLFDMHRQSAHQQLELQDELQKNHKEIIS